jgi:hypothetical protein
MERWHRLLFAARDGADGALAPIVRTLCSCPNTTTFRGRSCWLRMLELGGNIYYTFKLAASDGLTFQQLAALQTGVSEAEYQAMMVAGGRSVEGNRSRVDG